jgi:hypothetical protein
MICIAKFTIGIMRYIHISKESIFCPDMISGSLRKFLLHSMGIFKRILKAYLYLPPLTTSLPSPPITLTSPLTDTNHVEYFRWGSRHTWGITGRDQAQNLSTLI